MENVNGVLKCTIYGSNNFFGGTGKYVFNHSFDSALPPLIRIEGEKTSEALFNTQIFKFECIDEASDPDVSYSTTTRVTVVGNSMEILLNQDL